MIAFEKAKVDMHTFQTDNMIQSTRRTDNLATKGKSDGHMSESDDMDDCEIN